MELHAEDAAAARRPRRTARRASRRRDGLRRDRGRVRMREVDLRCRPRCPSSSRELRGASQRVPADVRHLERAAVVAGQPRARGPAIDAEPGDLRRLVAALEQPLHAEADAEQRRARRRPRARIAARHSPSSAAVAPKWPTPGTTMPLAPASSGGVGWREQLRAGRGEPLADRRQVAGAVVDERDHSSPLVLGSIRARRAIRAHATRSARANALNTASI